MDDLVQSVKAKKGLENLDDSFVLEKIEKVLSGDARIKQKYDKSNDFKQFTRSKEYEKLLKAVRKELRVVYGVFQEGDREGLLASKDSAGILETHTSTRERLPYYDLFYKELADRIPSPKRIIDLGCGMNPLSYPFMVKHGWRPFIVASDISKADMEFLQKAFSVFSIPGDTLALDLTKEYEKLQELDGEVTLLLKLLDSLEEAHRHISYKIMENIPSKWIVVSFPTMSLGGKKRISMKGRSWFERLLHRFKWEWETFSLENELVYVIDTQSRL